MMMTVQPQADEEDENAKRQRVRTGGKKPRVANDAANGAGTDTPVGSG